MSNSNYIYIPEGIKIFVQKNKLFLKGDLGGLSITLPGILKLKKVKNKLFIFVVKSAINNKNIERKNSFISLIKSRIKGLYSLSYKNIFLNGIGYKAYIHNNKLYLSLGYSHKFSLAIPKNMFVISNKPNVITIIGYNKENINLFASQIKKLRLPEPYKGKGIYYQGETIVKKEGKGKLV
uniref:ribosomal protein L6 n=1 Tax=Meteora sporadica TaxID=2913902 RepID=UPI00300369AB|nr:ribosomal protein L6 [Meteora sporadica]WVH37083.1 ribosomal protein L6 [Meteora sporadica]